MLQPGDRIGDWIVSSSLGEGGMGAVYRCHNAMSERIEAAVKVIKPHNIRDEKERFIREVEALDALHHRAVVGVKGWGEDPQRGVLWLAMDLAIGEDLDLRLHRGKLTVAEAVPLFQTVADGLQHAHERGIFHRDIKPANIILCADGTSRVVDFGIAVQKGRTRLTAMGAVAGTPAYMAPEVFQGEGRPDPVLLDVYALGQVLHEALTGIQAYAETGDNLSTGQALVQIMSRKLTSEPLDPGPGVPDNLRDLVKHATHPEPNKRLQSMAAFVEALNTDLTRGPTTPQATWGFDVPEPTPEPAKPRKDSKATKTGGGLILGGMVAGTGLVALLGFVAVLLLVVLGAAVVAFQESQPPPARDVKVVITGMAGDQQAFVTLDGRAPAASEGMTYLWKQVPPGPSTVAVSTGSGCTTAEALGACPACCACTEQTVQVEAGTGEQTLVVTASVPPPPGPRKVVVSVPGLAEGWTAMIDLGGAAGPTGVRVDERIRSYAEVQPGTYTLRVEAGVCGEAALGCSQKGGCPDGCSSWVSDIEVPCGTARHDIVVDLPTPVPAPLKAPSRSSRCRTACPTGAERAQLSQGALVEIIGLHEEDAYCGYEIVGVKGEVTGDLHPTDGCWLSGGLTAEDGTYYYFYKVAVKALGSATPPAPTGKRFYGPTVAPGTRIEILDLHPDDAFYGSRSSIVGSRCSVDEGLQVMEAGFFAGSVTCDGGRTFYFYKVGVTLR